MDAERHAHLERLLGEARGLPPEERAGYVDEASGDDDALRAQLEERLAGDTRRAGGAGDDVAVDEAPAEPNGDGGRPAQIGRYRIVGICGSGGMGTVYEAEQDSPSRRVALKVIQAGATRPELLRRFRRETEVLARLQHPGIAQIFEAGEFEQDGATRPFFAMEFVDGLPLTEFADELGLGTESRIGLFLQVCDAIHYAHGQGVIHRDLKPDNILVRETTEVTEGPGEASGQPKVLDFGVARVVDADARATVATGVGALLGSVVYMSPEQAAGDAGDIDGRSDLYSLGVVLFELLSGELPYEVRKRPLADALHAILHDEPSRLGSVHPALRGDLETIVGKCLEKDPARRYDTVAALAEDLRRFQQLKPITARPPSTWYQLQKFTQRNRALVGGAVATALAIIAGAIVAVVFALQSARNERAALESQAVAERSAYHANVAAASALLETDPAQARSVLARIPEDQRGWEHRYLSAALSGLLIEFGEVAPRDPGRHGFRAAGDMYLLAGGEQVIARRSADEFCIWETRTGRVVRTFRAPAEVDIFAVASGGSRLAAGLTSGLVVVGDPGAVEPGWEVWDGGTDPIDALAVGPAGRSIAVDRSSGLRFGRPDAWHEREHLDDRAWSKPALLRFDGEGARLAWVADSLHVFDCATGELVAEPIASEQGHWSIAFSPDGSRVAAGQYRREIRAFDPATGEYDLELLGHEAPVEAVEYGGADRLLSVSRDGTLRVWDLGTAEPLGVVDAPDTAKALFVDEEHVLSLTGGRFHLWQVEGRRARELVGHDGHVFVPVFSPDGGLLATSAPWADIAVWDPLETAPLRTVRANRRLQFAFTPSGDELLASHMRWGRLDERVPWAAGEAEVRRDDVRGPYHMQLGGAEAIVDGRSAPASPGGLHVHRNEHRMGGGDPLVRVDGEALALATPASPPTTPHLGEQPLLALGGLRSYEFNGPIAEWICFRGALEPADAAAVDAYLAARRAGGEPDFPALPGAPSVIAHFRASEESVAIDGDSRVLAWTAENDADLRLTPRGRPASSVRFVPAEGGAPALVRVVGDYGTHRWLETALPAAAGAERLTVCWLGGFSEQNAIQTAYALGEPSLPFEDLPSAALRQKVGPHLSFSRDGRLFADSWSEEQGGSVTVRDRATGVAVQHFEGAYWGVDFHPDSRRLACGGADGVVDVFDVTTGERLARIEGHDGACYDVAFSPDGTRLATSGHDNALRLWDAVHFEPLLEFPGHRSYIRGVAWSPDSTMLVSACADYTVRVWDSVPRDERYAEALADRALEDDVRPEVDAIVRSEPTAEDALHEIGRRWAADPERRHAAIKVLARRNR